MTIAVKLSLHVANVLAEVILLKHLLAASKSQLQQKIAHLIFMLQLKQGHV